MGLGSDATESTTLLSPGNWMVATDGDNCHPHHRFSTHPACLGGKFSMQSPGRAHLVSKAGHEQGRLASEFMVGLDSMLGTFPHRGRRFGFWTVRNTHYLYALLLFLELEQAQGDFYLAFMSRASSDRSRLCRLLSYPG